MTLDDRLRALRDAVQIDIGNRGLARDPADNLFTACADDFAAACRSIAEHAAPRVGIVTGFMIPSVDPPTGETDGPPGALTLAQALTHLGIPCVLLSDRAGYAALWAGLELLKLDQAVTLIDLPMDLDPAAVLHAARPVTHLIAIERCGPSRSGRNHTMRGQDVTDLTAPAHRLFEGPRDYTTIGIGDGGNEIGMGKVPHATVCKNIPNGDQIACRTATDYLVVAGISNWGAWALAAGVMIFRGQVNASLFDPDGELKLLEHLVANGPLVDGVTGQRTATVDGLAFAEYAQPLGSPGVARLARRCSARLGPSESKNRWRSPPPLRYSFGMTALPPLAVMERVVTRRDTDFDGVFVVAVRTTGIFCRPSCPARPLPQNRVYYPSAGDALRAGYRPCKRCRPLLAGGAVPDWVGRLFEAVEAAPGRRVPDKQLRALGADPVTARRYFLHHFGMTFQAYCRGRRLGEAFRQLKRGAPLDTIALENGYESLSGFRDAFGKVFGSPPRRANGSCVMVSWVESPVSPLLLGATDAGLCAVEFVGRTDLNGQFTELQDSLRTPVVPGTNKHIHQATRELGEYFAGQRTDFTVPLDVKGTPFQRAVWGRLVKIPYGETCSYEDLARAVNKSPTACRAVGQANGRNRIVILIPCHRVVNKDGSLGGYGGGLWRKRFLLELERKYVKS